MKTPIVRCNNRHTKALLAGVKRAGIQCLRAAEMVEVGYRCALEAAPMIRKMLEQRVSVWGTVAVWVDTERAG